MAQEEIAPLSMQQTLTSIEEYQITCDKEEGSVFSNICVLRPMK